MFSVMSDLFFIMVLPGSRGPGSIILDGSSKRIFVIIIVKLKIGDPKSLAFYVVEKVLGCRVIFSVNFVTEIRELLIWSRVELSHFSMLLRIHVFFSFTQRGVDA